MRHRVQKRHFNRDTNHRKHLLRNLVRSLVEKGEITTTVAKAKETKRIADKLVGKAAKNDINTRRVLHRFFGKRDVVNTLVDSVAPAMSDRKSGFTTISKVGKRRGDNTELVKLSFVTKAKNVGSLNSDKPYETRKVKAKSPKKVAKKKVASKVAKASKTEASKKPASKKTTKKPVKKS